MIMSRQNTTNMRSRAFTQRSASSKSSSHSAGLSLWHYFILPRYSIAPREPKRQEPTLLRDVDSTAVSVSPPLDSPYCIWLLRGFKEVLDSRYYSCSPVGAGSVMLLPVLQSSRSYAAGDLMMISIFFILGICLAPCHRAFIVTMASIYNAAAILSRLLGCCCSIAAPDRKSPPDNVHSLPINTNKICLSNAVLPTRRQAEQYS